MTLTVTRFQCCCSCALTHSSGTLLTAIS